MDLIISVCFPVVLRHRNPLAPTRVDIRMLHRSIKAFADLILEIFP